MIHDAHPIATQFLGHGCMDDLKAERSFGSHDRCVIIMLSLYFLTCYQWVFLQPGTGRCPVDWCRN